LKATGGYGALGALGEITLTWAKPPAGGCTGGACSLSGYTLSYQGQVTKTNSHGQTGTYFESTTQVFPAAATSGKVDVPLNLLDDTLSLVANNLYGASQAVGLQVPLEVVPLAPKVDVLPPPSAAQVALQWVDEPIGDKNAGIGPVSGFEVYEGTSSNHDSGPRPPHRSTSSSRPATTVPTRPSR
jgi:hypothetical protein